MRRRKQLQPFAIFATSDERNFATAKAIVRQGRGPGTAIALNLETGDPRA